MAKLNFLGAARTTTGSKHLLQWKGQTRTHRILVDCGMFQGLKELRLKNWDEFPVNPEIIDAVLLTHGHLDHVGYLPRLSQMGFDGPIYATAATIDLAEVILRDSAHIQMEDAKHAKKFGYSKHEDPKPLYTDKDVENVLKLFKPLDYYHSYHLIEGCTIRLFHAGHILGSSFIEVTVEEDGQPIRVVFSGDVGRFDQPILQDPEPPTGADYFLLEGTYGNRTHSKTDPLDEISEVVNRTIERGGSVVIPAFAVGRSQQLLYYLSELMDAGRIPPIDVFLDSPMAVRVTEMTRKHQGELDLQTLLGVRSNSIFKRPEVHLLEKREQSMMLNERTDPCVIVSASGMASAGRILHHLKIRLPDEKNTVLLVGYQGVGTRGRRLVEGEKEVKIHGQMVPVNAEVVNMSSLSAHADWTEMMPWLNRMVPPAVTFLVHGEIENLEDMQTHINEELGWKTYIPVINEEVEILPLDPATRKVAPFARGIQAIVAVGSDISALPPGIVVDKTYTDKPSATLAEQILKETETDNIYLIGGNFELEEETAFCKALIEKNRKIWRISSIG